MSDEDKLFKKRINELAERSYNKSQFTYTAFLNQAELDLFYQMLSELKYVSYTIFGGAENTERQMIRFGSGEFFGFEEDFPICIIKAEPLIYKFADDITHRDFLGALMNLGIERNIIGDIMVNDKTGYIFCLKQMSSYIIENLERVRHTQIKCTLLADVPEIIKPKLETVKLAVSSMRCDVIVAKLYNLSRNQSLILFKEKKIFINSRNSENNCLNLKEGDIVTIRGFGKFIIHNSTSETKKGKMNVAVEIYK